MLKLTMFGHDPIIELDDNFEVDPREEQIRSEMYLNGYSYIEAANAVDNMNNQNHDEVPF